MTHQTSEHHLDTAVIGGGQASLAMGCFLSRQDRAFVILDAGDRVGETWRNRWDLLKLFTPAFHDGLPGMPFPAPGGYLPTKDEAADYLELYARKFALPVRFGRHVDSLVPHHDGYLLSAGHERYVTEQVVVATGPYQRPKIPGFAADLDPTIAQMHSSAYRNPDQLPEADVLVVGAGNSGAEISVDLAATRNTYLSGRDAGYIPVGLIHNRLSLWLADHVLTTDTRLGRKMTEAHRDRGPRSFASSSRRSQRQESNGYPGSRALWTASPSSQHVCSSFTHPQNAIGRSPASSPHSHPVGRASGRCGVELLLIIGGLFVLAGLCEIGGYLVWGWMQEHKPLLWALLGAAILAAYGVVAALQPITEFGRV